MTNPVKDIDDYLSSVPEDLRSSLEELRKVIKEVVPAATERISYQIPTFFYHGSLVAFSVSAKQRVSKKYYSLHVISPSLMRSLKDEVKQYETTTSTIHIPFDGVLPVTLVKKLVRARIEENEGRSRSRKKSTEKN